MTEPNYCEPCRIIFYDYILEYHGFPTVCPQCNEGLGVFDASTIDIVDRIGNEIDGDDDWETDAVAEIERLRSDNAKLRAACEAFIDAFWYDKTDNKPCGCAMCDAYREAMTALEETK